MEETKDILIDEEVRPYLDKIAEHLWSGHGAVMVGSGFSKNAKSSPNTKSKFPDWNGLGDLFYKENYGNKTGNKEYLNILKLADEYQAAFGRPALDLLLRSNIPDNDYAPSELHTKLLKLPWTDVFTTNYDTLLDRAKNDVPNRFYQVVINQEDLVYSASPRIIKLHGSFPSERPFIITEEDYRRYPKNFAPFVNTVQQALLENMLCLIGFSGDDPNFLNWIGWIRDNLGVENSPKIYLIGIINLSKAQRMLLEQRNIIIVDLKNCQNIKDDHYKALDLFCDYLMSKGDEDNRIDWPDAQKLSNPNNKADKNEQLKSILSELRKNHGLYPEWCVLPEDRRRLLFRYIESWIKFVSLEVNIAAPMAIELIYELNWLLEKCLWPIFDDFAELLINMINKYWPFPDADIVNKDVLTPESPGYEECSWRNIRQMWLHLNLSLLRSFREKGRIKHWEDMEKRISAFYEYLSPDHKAFYHYESALFALFMLDIPEVKNKIKAWPKNESLPFWETKRAGILAEIGQVDEAERILEEALHDIRSKLNLRPITTDYSLVSQEAYTMLLLQHVRNASCLRKNEPLKRNEFSDRFNTLKQYKCDPWIEFKLFKSYLEHNPIETPNILEKVEFEIGRTSRTLHFANGADHEAILAYTFLRFCEESGIPFRIDNFNISNTSAIGTLARISRYSSSWALVTMLRIGDEKIVEHIFNRESLHNMEIPFVDNLVNNYLNVLNNNKNEIQVGNGFQSDNFGIIMAKVIPEVLSRLCCKCSLDAKNELLNFLLILYKTDQKNKYHGIGNLTRRLISSYSMHQQYEIIPKLLEFPVLANLGPIIENEFPNPIFFIFVDKKQIIDWNKPKIDREQIQMLLNKAKSEISDIRKWSINTLIKLYELDLLSEVDTEELGRTIWLYKDDNGLPADTDCYKYSFSRLPHPAEVDPISLFKRYIQVTPFPLQNNGSGISITFDDRIPMNEELDHSSRIIHWTEEEAICLLNRIIEWWNADKFLLNREDPFSLIKNEVRNRFKFLVGVLTGVIIPCFNISTDMHIKDTLIHLLSELEEFGISSLRAAAVAIRVFPDSKNNIISRVEDALASSSKEVVWDGLDAIYSMVMNSTLLLNESELVSNLSMLSQLVRWRRKIGLERTLYVVANIIGELPDCLKGEFEESLIKGLDKLAEETNLSSDSTDFCFSEKLEIRKNSAYLAYSMFVNYNENKKDIPEIINTWRDICYSNQEFSEIRNQWIVTDN